MNETNVLDPGKTENNDTTAESAPQLYGGPRGTAVKVLNRIERSDAYLDKVLEKELSASDMNELDKGLFNEIVHGVIRWRMRLDWLLTGFFHGNFTKAETNVRNCLRVALYQILFLNRIPHSAAVNEAVEFIKRIRGQKTADLVNAVLRNLIRSLENLRYPDPGTDLLHHLSVTESHPLWMVQRWMERFGESETRALLGANNLRPDLTLRINTLKIAPDSLVEMLRNHNIEFEQSKYLPSFVRVRHLADIGESGIFQKGFCSVQDESAGLVVALLDPQPGERIIDLCSAPGGKTSFIGEAMRNEGHIVAVDKYDTRLASVADICRRLGITIVERVEADATVIQLQPGDRVLADVPCSGLGILRKKPDIKWRRSAEELRLVTVIQEKILENAATLVRPGGILVYSTCTIEPEENEEQVLRFIEKHRNFELEPANVHVAGDLVSQGGFLETYPHRHGVDGAFAARLRRIL